MKKIFWLMLIGTLLFTYTTTRQIPATAAMLPYHDISTSYASEAISRLHASGIMQGTTATSFSPKRPVTRAEFMTVLMRAFGITPTSSAIPAYTDVPRSTWYYGAVQAATELGITNGLGNGTFRPEQTLSRQEAAVWLTKALKQAIPAASSISSYRDSLSIAAWAKPYVTAISALGLMQGSEGRFDPAQSITRQETAAIFDRLLEDARWKDTLTASAGPSPSSAIHIGWQYGQSTEAYQKSVMESNVNVLSPRWYFLESSGRISDSSIPSLNTWAQNNDKQVWAMVGNRFDQKATHQMLNSPSLSSTAIQSIKSYVQKYSLAGINIDFENVHASDRDLFTSFIATLAKELHNIQAVLSVDLPPDLGSDWSAAYNYAELAKHADYLVIMAYDEHWTGYKAGSVASLNWVEQHLDKLLTQVQADQLILGMPLYTRDWVVNAQGNTLSSEDLSLPEQNKRIRATGTSPRWNPEAGQYLTEYWKGDTKHRIWLEDARSLSTKLQLGMDRGLAGYAYWHIGGESPDIWTSLRNVEKYESYRFDHSK
ncbi:S-layer homology domain-containing protein [Paenibacillus sanguinis]|uniref:S-layer homology domain-containing protein n=1 Tax=Paenibacillus sanguinis TaxID=225906 RepID=UPI00037BFA46|nr:S-layer homology domain-containing protein [Paenibacillus sanguinis]